MQEFNRKDTQNLVSSLLRKIAEQVEKDNELAELLFIELSKFTFEKRNNIIESGNKGSSSTVLIELSELFSIFSQDGKEGIIKVLNQFEIEELKKIVAVNGLDPSQKVRKWKNKDKILQLITSVVEQKMLHGSAFMNNNQ